MPDSIAVPSLDELDIKQFNQLASQESFSIEGQTLSMMLIEDLIQERLDERRKRLRREYVDKEMPEDSISQAIEERMQPIKISQLDLGDGRYNLIVEKGDSEDVQYSIMMPAHVDTVEGEPESYTLSTNTNDADKLMGCGVYDMGAGVLNNIYLAAEAEVPPGMKVYFVFTADEEEKSLGATELVKQWSKWKEVDLVLSSEIGPLPLQEKDDNAMRLITARRGRQKFLGRINIDKQAQGHASLENMPNSSEALGEFLYAASRKFYRSNQVKGEKRNPLAKVHPILGKERFEVGELESKKDAGFVPTNRAKFGYSIHTVPPSRLAEVLEQQIQAFTEIAERGKWEQFRINWTLVQDPSATSYEPYSMPDDHAVVQIAKKVLEDVAGVAPVIAGAPSVADECIYAAAMKEELEDGTFENTNKGVLTIPPIGDQAHHPGEWVSNLDIARLRETMRILIEDESGLRKLYKGKTSSKK